MNCAKGHRFSRSQSWLLGMLAAGLLCLGAGVASANEESCDPLWQRIVSTPIPPQTINGLRRHDKVVSTFPSNSDIVLVGDSIAENWPADKLSRLFPGKKVTNLGDGGDWIQMTLWRLDQLPLDRLHPEEVLIMLGTNNLPHRPPACAIGVGIDRLLDKLRSVWPSSRLTVFLMAPRGPNLDDFETTRIEANSAIEAVASRYDNVRAIGGYDDALSCGLRGGTLLSRLIPSYFPVRCSSFRPDNLHLSPEGYDIVGSYLPGISK